MRRPRALIALMVLSLALASCATLALKTAPENPDSPWTPAINGDGEIIAGQHASTDQPRSNSYVLPPNRSLAEIPSPTAELERRRPYTLPELIDIAESNNPITHNAWNDARNAALAAGIAESTYLPMVSAGIVQGYQKFHVQNTILGSNLTNDITAKGNIAAVSIQWLLFDFGEREALVQAAQQGSVIANIAFTAAHQQVIYNVSLAFYAHAAARARLASAAKSLRDAEEVEAASQNRYKQGIGTVVELAQTQQATAQARLEQVQAEGAAQNTYLALITAIGVSPTTKLAIADIPYRKLSPSIVVPIDRIVTAALAQRPDVLTSYAAQQASLANLRAAEAAFFPKVFLAGNGTRSSGSLDVTAIPGNDQQVPILNLPTNQVGQSSTQLGGTALIGATVPLYDGGSRAALLEQARNNVDKAQTMQTQIRNEAVRQILMAANALKTSLAAHGASTALAAAARTTFNAALGSYRNGVGSISDVTAAQRQLLLAENTVTDSYSTAFSSAATLALAAGALGSAPQ